MTETVNVKTGEIIEELVPAKKTGIAALIKDQDIPLLEVVQMLETFDWKAMKPPQVAFLLMQKPFAASGGGQMFLSFRQALIFATRCFELQLSPFSAAVWFDPNRSSVNLTLEGKRELARIKGIDLGPPKFEEVTREWNEIPRASDLVNDLKKEGYTRDIGIKCSIRVGDPKHKEYGEYVAWLSEWMVMRSPVWKAKPIHMLQTRATEKCISMALGTGASDFPSDSE